MVNYPCECCGYQTISRAGAHPWVCATCMRIYKGIWKPGPGQPSREEITERIEALFAKYEPEAVKACKAYWDDFSKKLVRIKIERKERAVAKAAEVVSDGLNIEPTFDWLALSD